MPGFRGGLFVSCVVCLFRLRLPLPYLSRRSFCASLLPSRLFPSRPSLSFFSIPTSPSPSFVPFYALSPSLWYVPHSCAPSASSLTFLSPRPLHRRCDTVHGLPPLARTHCQCHLFSPSPVTVSPSLSFVAHSSASLLSSLTFVSPGSVRPRHHTVYVHHRLAHTHYQCHLSLARASTAAPF